MMEYFESLWQSLQNNWAFLSVAFIEILLIFVLVYPTLRFLKGSRGEGILKGLLIFFLLFMIAKVFRRDLVRVDTLYSMLLEVLPFAIVVIYQPELRRGLTKLGRGLDFFGRNKATPETEILEAVQEMSKNHIGALIVFESDDGLVGHIESGTRLDAAVSKELILNLFYKGSPLHDGAIIIRRDRIAAAGCILPLSENIANYELGTRHRAALGLAEETDAIVVVVSEQTGQISLAMDRRLERGISLEHLGIILRERVGILNGGAK